MNDADLQGYGVIAGQGVELALTLGTGLGAGLYVDGRLVPNLELGHHPWKKEKTYEERLSDWIAKLPALLVCVWMAPKGNAQTLLELQRIHREFVCGEDTFVKT